MTSIFLRPALALAISAASLAFAAPSLAQDNPGQAAQKTRETHFKEIGKAFKGINDQIKSGSPDMGVVKADAATVKGLSTQVPSWFPADSAPSAGVKTRAKPEVWRDPAGFAAAAAFRVQAAKLDVVATGPADLAALKGQFAATGATCKACHDKYRVPEDH